MIRIGAVRLLRLTAAGEDRDRRGGDRISWRSRRLCG